MVIEESLAIDPSSMPGIPAIDVSGFGGCGVGRCAAALAVAVNAYNAMLQTQRTDPTGAGIAFAIRLEK